MHALVLEPVFEPAFEAKRLAKRRRRVCFERASVPNEAVSRAPREGVVTVLARRKT